MNTSLHHPNGFRRYHNINQSIKTSTNNRNIVHLSFPTGKDTPIISGGNYAAVPGTSSIDVIRGLAQNKLMQSKKAIDNSLRSIHQEGTEVFYSNQISPENLQHLNSTVDFVTKSALNIIKQDGGYALSEKNQAEIESVNAGVSRFLQQYTDNVNRFRNVVSKQNVTGGSNVSFDNVPKYEVDSLVQSVKDPLLHLSRKMDLMYTVLDTMEKFVQ